MVEQLTKRVDELESKQLKRDPSRMREDLKEKCKWTCTRYANNEIGEGAYWKEHFVK